ALGRNSIPGAGTADFTDYIQTDAAINQGNSGGALVNLNGEVVGMNSWIASNSGGNIGLGFSIPINTAKKDIESLISKGKIEYGWLGASIGSVPDDLAADMKLAGANGAFIYNIFRGSPADLAGIVPGDFVTALNGTPVKNSNQLLQMIGNLSPGDRASFDIIRAGSKTNLTAKIAVRAAEEEIAKQAGQVWPGMYIANVNDDVRKSLSLPAGVKGVVIASVDKGSASEIAGLRQGDVIEKIGDRNIGSTADFYSLMGQKTGAEISFRVFRQGVEISVGIVR
ncbi:MAG: PDZ domain-containing protein, partial [Spirochaetales bacterium]